MDVWKSSGRVGVGALALCGGVVCEGRVVGVSRGAAVDDLLVRLIFEGWVPQGALCVAAFAV
jgi:ABC-type cobalamin transport system permease subunit